MHPSAQSPVEALLCNEKSGTVLDSAPLPRDSPSLTDEKVKTMFTQVLQAARADTDAEERPCWTSYQAYSGYLK